MAEARRLAAYVARVQQLLRALEADPGRPADPVVRVLVEGLGQEGRWVMGVAERLQREEDDGR